MANKVILNNFTRGELTPRLRSRTDLSFYQHGCSILENMVVWPQGGATSRPGTQYIATTKTDGKKVWLIPFVFSTDEAYVLEFGDLYIRFYRTGAQIQSGGAAYEISTPYLEADLPYLKITQSADILYIEHPSYWPRQLMRFADAAWGISKMTMRDGPFLDENATEITLTPTFKGYNCNARCNATDGTKIWVLGTGGYGGYSTDDVVFTGCANVLTLNGMKWINSLFVAVGNKGTVLEAAAGATGWTSRTPTGITSNFRDVVWAVNSTKYVICGDGGKIYTHAAPLTTGSYTSQTTGVTKNLMGIAYRQNTTNDELVAVGQDGQTIRSADGVNWTAGTCGTTDLNAVAWHAATGLFIAIGEKGKIYTSTDRATWTDRSPGFSKTLRGIDATGNTVIVCGDDGLILTSTDGINWALRNLENGLKLFDVCNRNNAFYCASGEYGLMAVSTDMINWTIRGVRTATFAASEDIFDNADQALGRQLRWSHITANSQFWGWGTIIKYTNGDDFVCDVRRYSFSAYPLTYYATKSWCLGVFYGSEAATSKHKNFPTCGGFYEQRMLAAAPPSHPQTVYASRSGDWRDWSPTNWGGRVPDDSGIVYTLTGAQVNAILWFMSTQYVLAGSKGGPWKISGADGNSPITPLNFNAKQQCSYPTANVSPILAGNSVFFVERFGLRVRELYWQNDEQLFAADDLCKASQHITETGVIQLAMSHTPDPVIWAPRTDGQLLSCTYDKIDQVEAWTRHRIANGDGLVESVAVIPGTAADEVWMSVKITIGGTAKRHIVRSYAPAYSSDITAAFFVDDGIVYSGAGVTTITGLGHLEGKTVAVLGNGKYLGTKVVTSGQITGLSESVTKASVGLPFTRKLQSMDLSQAEMARVSKITARLIDTGYAKVGYDSTHCDPLNITSATLFTGDKIINNPKGAERNYYGYIESSVPLPLNVAGLVLEMT